MITRPGCPLDGPRGCAETRPRRVVALSQWCGVGPAGDRGRPHMALGGAGLPATLRGGDLWLGLAPGGLLWGAVYALGSPLGWRSRPPRPLGRGSGCTDCLGLSPLGGAWGGGHSAGAAAHTRTRGRSSLTALAAEPLGLAAAGHAVAVIAHAVTACLVRLCRHPPAASPTVSLRRRQDRVASSRSGKAVLSLAKQAQDQPQGRVVIPQDQGLPARGLQASGVVLNDQGGRSGVNSRVLNPGEGC